EGILYMTANSSSGSKYYDLVPRMQTYIANRWQEDVPTYSVIDIDDDSFTINTYRTDNDEAIDDTFTIVKTDEDAIPFTDVSKDAWYYDAVVNAYQNKLFSGMSETTFGPDITMSRGMFVQVLYSMAGKPEVSGEMAFTDVKTDDWYCDAVKWAEQNGIAAGTGDGKFSPNASVTREQAAALMKKVAEKMGKDTSARADLSKYTDANRVSDWAKDAVSWAAASDIMTGTGTTTLSPRSNATRAQVAQIMMRFCEAVK
ncbi:MAG: S-layer homology domain-containing protein, partial [Butyricicoccus porcorum]